MGCKRPMKNIHKSYKYRIYPTKEQESLLSKHFGCVRYIYNHFLNERKEKYQEHKKSPNYYAQAKTLTGLKKKKETDWLKEVNSQTLQHALRHLDTAYLNFFRGKAKFPRFKSKKNKNSFTIPQFVTVENDRLNIPKFKEGIKINLHRKLEGEIKHCTISKTPTGKYFVSILCEVKYQPKEKTGKSVGIDLGLKDFVITSDGIKYENHKHLKQYEKQLAKAQKHLSRKVKGSNRRNKQRMKVAVLHERTVNARLDLLHKISTQITNEYDTICVEDLNVKGMMANHKLAKHIADASWGTFVRLLEYKADWNNKQVVKINRWYPSSKTCSECGWIHQDLNLSEREWTCANGHKLDRDINASKNILLEGLKIISSGTGDYTRRAKIRPQLVGAQALKREAHLSLVNG